MNRGTLPFKPAAVAGSLSSGITLATAGADLFAQAPTCYRVGEDEYRIRLRTSSLKKAIAADAALAFGQKLLDFPAGYGYVLPTFSRIALTRVHPSGLSSTAGEVGLGTTIGSGAVAVLSGTAAFENFLTGQTLGNAGAAATTTETVKSRVESLSGIPATIDASVNAAALYANLASTFDQTAAESVTFSLDVLLQYKLIQVP